MSTNSIDSTKATDPLAAATSQTKAKSDPLGEEAFMHLLVTQLQNQDPTQPQDNSAFIAQLAQFSSLEQLQHMNQTLTTIAKFFNDVQSVTSSSATDATGASKTTGATGAITGN